jgi:hypothetical protein
LINLEKPRCFFVATEINLISSAAKSIVVKSSPHRSIAVHWGERKDKGYLLAAYRDDNASRKGRSDTACSAFRLESPRKGRAERKPQQWAQRSLETSMYDQSRESTVLTTFGYATPRESQANHP